MDKITIVDKNDKVIGSEERSIVYKKGLNHRLIRIFLFNDKNQLLLQWRSKDEDTFPETWDQSAGGHVDAGESYEIAAARELEEELGLSDIPLKEITTFFTSGEFGNKKINRFNRIYTGRYTDQEIKLQQEEVEKVKWFDLDFLIKDIEDNSERYTHGLISILKDYSDRLCC